MRCTPCSSTGSPTTPHVSSSRRRRLGLDISWDVSVEDGCRESSRERRRAPAAAPLRRAAITRARREAKDVVRFIGAHGGRLGAFRSYQRSHGSPSRRLTRTRDPPRSPARRSPPLFPRLSPTLAEQRLDSPFPR